ncbi:MAG: DUF192 domain-containing protein, partial [Verrucomicrobia bacterium]
MIENSRALAQTVAMKQFKLWFTLVLAAGVLAGCGSSTNSAGSGGATNSNAVTTTAPATITNADGTVIDATNRHLLHAQPKLPTLKVWLGDQELITELATQSVQIATGMMFRTNLLENEAMLFVFPDAAPRNFYMRNCVVPLTAAYISPDGVIQEFARLVPGDEIGVQSRAMNIQFVLELPQGWHERHNIQPGAVVRTER